MAFWDSYDARYKQARRLAIACAAAVVLSAVGVALLFLLGDRTESKTDPIVAQQTVAEAPSHTPAPDLSKEPQIQELRQKLKDAIATRELDTCAALATSILDLKSQDPEALSCLAWVHEQKGDSSEALSFYNQAVESSTDNKSYYLFLRAGFYRKMKGLPAAITDMKEAVRLDPGSVAMNNLLMIYQMQGGQVEEVRRTLAEFQAVDLESQKAQWQLGAAALALHEGNFLKAAQCFELFEAYVPSALFVQLTSDPYFDAYRTNPELQRHILKLPSSTP